MKNFLLVIILSIASTVTILASNPIPKVVQKTFTKLYPQVECPLWENRHDGIVAIFQDMDGLKKAFFEENGKWVKTRVQLNKDQLPQGVAEFIQDHYREANITFCGKVYNQSKEWYRVESELSDQVIMKNFDKNGILLDKESLPLNTIHGDAP